MNKKEQRIWEWKYIFSSSYSIDKRKYSIYEVYEITDPS